MKQEVSEKVETSEQTEMLDEALMKEAFEADVKNKRDEIERGEKNLKEHEFVLEQHLEILRLLKEAYPIILDGIKVINPTYEYETSEAYTALNKGQQKLKLDQEIFRHEEQVIPSLEKTIEAKKENIKGLKEALAKMLTE